MVIETLACVEALTVVVALAVLFDRLMSPAEVLAIAVFVRLAAAEGVATTVIVALAPGAKSPRFAVITPPAFDAVPTVEVAETKVRPAGSGSVKTADVAVLLLLRFFTVIV